MTERDAVEPVVIAKLRNDCEAEHVTMEADDVEAIRGPSYAKMGEHQRS